MLNRDAPIVQWIEYWIPVPTIGVRLPMGVLTDAHYVAGDAANCVRLLLPIANGEKFTYICVSAAPKIGLYKSEQKVLNLQSNEKREI